MAEPVITDFSVEVVKQLGTERGLARYGSGKGVGIGLAAFEVQADEVPRIERFEGDRSRTPGVEFAIQLHFPGTTLTAAVPQLLHAEVAGGAVECPSLLEVERQV